MYSAIIQIRLTQDVILNPLKFEQQSFDQGFQFKFVWIFRYSILSDQLALVSNVCSDLLTICLFNFRLNHSFLFCIISACSEDNFALRRHRQSYVHEFWLFCSIGYSVKYHSLHYLPIITIGRVLKFNRQR